MHMRRAGHLVTRPLNCGVRRLFRVVRWVLVVPSALVAWYLASVLGGWLVIALVAPCMSSNGPEPAFCEAAWFPQEN